MILDELISLIENGNVSLEYLLINNRKFKKKKGKWRYIVRADAKTVDCVYEYENIFEFLPITVAVKQDIYQIWIHEGLIEIYYNNDDMDSVHLEITTENWKKCLC